MPDRTPRAWSHTVPAAAALPLLSRAADPTLRSWNEAGQQLPSQLVLVPFQRVGAWLSARVQPCAQCPLSSRSVRPVPAAGRVTLHTHGAVVPQAKSYKSTLGIGSRQ